MRIRDLSVTNFRAIERVELSALSQMVVVAGPNGVGKSCLFDAIRLIKSAYGGYSQNEWSQWFGEFQIDFDGRRRGQRPMQSVMRDPAKLTRIEMGIDLTDAEWEFLDATAGAGFEASHWNGLQAAPASPIGSPQLNLARQQRQYKAEVRQRVARDMKAFTGELKGRSLLAVLEIEPSSGELVLRSSPTLELVFSTYTPEKLGVVDYHGPNRTYGRERMGGINLTDAEENGSAHALYNYTNKYSRVKAEMASGYLRELVAAASGIPTVRATLQDTLKELFATFFPTKMFQGPVPTAQGSLQFLVKCADGSSHDIDELSSGEKEIIYGYLRLRNSAPRGSVLLLDEPELHLNPRLVRGLPQFYRKHLGTALDNQLWLVTHSDALLRSAVEEQECSVFHMRSPTADDVGTAVSQAKPMSARRDVERAIIDLVGDLAIYQPGARVVVFEGGGDVEFDKWMVEQLYPRASAHANLLSGGNKSRVRQLYKAIASAQMRAQLGFETFCVTDRDSDDSELPVDDTHVLRWDVYHIENYLLHEPTILRVVRELSAERSQLHNESEVTGALVEEARANYSRLVLHRLRVWADKLLLQCIRLGASPTAQSFAAGFVEQARASAAKMQSAVTDELSIERVSAMEASIRAEYLSSIDDGSWRSKVRGRDILSTFVARHVPGVSYEQFRNLLVSRMSENSYRPIGMTALLDKIIA